MLIVIVATTISFVICFAFTKYPKLSNGFTRQHDLSAVQSMHTKPTLRLAGIAIFVSVFITDALFELGSELLRTILLSSLPLLALGLLEDIGIYQSPSRRLVSSIVAGSVFMAITGTYLQNPGTFLLDALFEYRVIAVFFTLFITSGIVNSFNLIDGLNGLSGSVALVTTAGIAAISYDAGLNHIMLSATVICGAVIGFMVLNFPFGKIFLGDSGAYGIGFMLSWMSLEVLMEAPEISPWAMLMIFFWPIADTTLTISRRIMSGRPVGQPDRLHFHQVVMRIIEISLLGRKARKYSNPLATIVIFPFMALPALFAVFFEYNNALIAALFWIFMALFNVAYYVVIKSAPRLKMKYDRKRVGPGHLK